MDFPAGKYFGEICLLSYRLLGFPSEERSDHGSGISGKFRYGSLCDHFAAVDAGSGTHLDDPVCFGEYLGVVVNQQDGIAVRDQVVHHAGQPDNIRRMQPDGRLVQHIEDACSPVAHCPCKLHPLPFSGGQRGGGPVQRQISQSQIKQSLC